MHLSEFHTVKPTFYSNRYIKCYQLAFLISSNDILTSSLPTDFISETTQLNNKLPSEENKFMFTSLEAFVAQASHPLPQNGEESQEVPKNLFEAVLSTIDHEKIPKVYSEIGK